MEEEVEPEGVVEAMKEEAPVRVEGVGRSESLLAIVKHRSITLSLAESRVRMSPQIRSSGGSSARILIHVGVDARAGGVRLGAKRLT